jgi:sulfofructosephosphate aldolase
VTYEAEVVSEDPTRPLQTPTGHYAMLALDQRESLRGMFGLGPSGSYVGDDTLRRFKRSAVASLSGHASAVLLDRTLGLSDGAPPGLAAACGLIVAVDMLDNQPGREIMDVAFDHEVTPDFLASVRASAVKLLVAWRRDGDRRKRAELVTQAIDLARAAGVASLIEGIVRPSGDGRWSDPAERHEAILDCARELVEFGPDIYKVEVPGYVPGDLSRVEDQSALMSEIVGGDWVILSNGVAPEAFPEALAAAMRGGARGFLAGRAIWANAVEAPDPVAVLESQSVSRLQGLTDIVNRSARVSD